MGRLRDILDSGRRILLEDTYVNVDLTATLLQNDVITGDESEEILAENTAKKKANKLMDIVRRKGDEKLEPFIRSLREANHVHVADHLVGKLNGSTEKQTQENTEPTRGRKCKGHPCARGTLACDGTSGGSLGDSSSGIQGRNDTKKLDIQPTVMPVVPAAALSAELMSCDENTTPRNLQKKAGDEVRMAAKNNDINKVRQLVGAGADPSAAGQYNHTALHHASSRGHEETVEFLLLEAGVDANMRDDGGSTSLHLASSNGLTSLIMVLLKAGADYTLRDNNDCTAIHCAAERGETEAVGLLLDAGCDPDQTGKCGRTALHYAAAKGRTDTIKLLLERRCRRELKDNKGCTAIDYAKNKQQQAAVDLLLN